MSKITLDDFKHVRKVSSKWELPGKDKIPNWLNSFHEIHTRLTQLYNLVITDQKPILQWLVSGITCLLPKSNETSNSKNYHPITCLTAR